MIKSLTFQSLYRSKFVYTSNQQNSSVYTLRFWWAKRDTDLYILFKFMTGKKVKSILYSLFNVFVVVVAIVFVVEVVVHVCFFFFEHFPKIDHIILK